MADILLINPPLSSGELFKRGSKSTASIIPPLGLAYLAAVLENEGHQVKIIDGIATDISIDSILRVVDDFDFVGVTVLSTFFKRCIELIEKIKVISNVPVIAGGAHATVMPLSLLEKGADYIVIGEGEDTIKELIGVLTDKLSLKIDDVRGIAFLRDGKMVLTGRRPLIKDLNNLPMPARHLLPMDKYKTSEARTNRNPSHSIVVSRGCKGNCTFCFKGTFGTEFRCLSPERIVEEMFVLRDVYKAKEISFWDDSFTTDRNIVLSVCELLLQKKLGIPWSCEARIDTVDEEMLRIMKRAGCEFIAYGIESGSDRVLRSINKRIDTKTIVEVIRKTQAVGIPIRGYFILGLVGELKEEMHRTIQFAASLKIDIATFTLLVPSPGSADYVRAQRDGGDFDPNFFRKKIVPEFNFLEEPVYCPQGLSPGKLLEIHRSAYRKFYCQPSFIIKELLKIRGLQDLKRLFKGFKTLMQS